MKILTPNISQLRMIQSIRGHQWMIRPDKVSEFVLAALDVPEKKAEFDLADYYDLRTAAFVDPQGVGHVEIKGALLQTTPKIYEKLGLATKYQTIVSEIETVISAGASAVLFHVNSPGGTVAGNVETAKFIQAISVPKAGYCTGLCCSAAYKLSAGMDFIMALPSAEVGNIGVILTWADCTEFWKEAGVEFKALVNTGADLKSTFHLEPDETQTEFLQEQLNAMGEEFASWVKMNRPMVSQEVFRAGWYHDTKAEELGLIDGTGRIEEAIAELLSRVF